MKSHKRTSSKREGFSLSKTASHDSCLDQIEETFSYTGSSNSREKNSKQNSNRRFTMISSSSRSSLMDISKSNMSGSRRFLAFFQKGFHGSKSKSINKLDNPNFIKITNERSYLDALNDVVPIPIRETAIQGHSKTLYHKIPKSNVRAKPLLKLGDETKFVPIHPSLLSKNFHYCVKIISLSPNIYRNCSSGNKYELLLPTGTRSLGHTCHIVTTNKLQEQCPSCHSSQLSLFGGEEQQKHMMGYVFSCSSESERKKWISVLTRVVRPNLQNERRQEISLNLWIQEAKNVALKKRYFCEIYLDETLHAKTTTKTMTDMLFWGEEFHLCHLEEVKTVTILLWKATNDNRVKKKKPQQQLICQVNIDTKDIMDRNSIEKWYPASYSFNSSGAESSSSIMNQSIISSTDTTSTATLQSTQIANLSHSIVSLSTNDHTPMIRIRARYQNIDVLPINEYSNFIEFLKQHAVQLLLEMDSYLKVKNKEDLVGNLINVLHKQGTAVDFLSDLLFHEINKADDENMILRGNTMASKAIEVYLKLIGEKYLNLILSDFVIRISQGDEDCEVDPLKTKCDFYSNSSSNGSQSTYNSDKPNNSQYNLQQRQESLLMNVDMVWAKIMSSSIYFPKDLKSVFITLRARLEHLKKNSDNNMNDSPSNLCERIVSACIFLRFICPAILTPSLFGLIPEYPDNTKVLRTFTLVAKCIQSLANFSDLTGCKESYMMFMNSFIENKFETMHSFLKEISMESGDENNRSKLNSRTSPHSPNENGLYWENLSNTLSEDSIDISLCLAKLHRQFEDYLKIIPAQKFSRNIEILHNIIVDINEKLSFKEVANEQISMKYSQSYQDMKMDQKCNIDIERNNCNEMLFKSTLTRNSTKSKLEEINSKISNCASLKPKKIKSSSISFSTETSPTHSVFDKQSTSSNYLMTRSMLEDTQNYSIVSHPTEISREQVDKEWKEMVSKSNYYGNHIDVAVDHISASQNLHNSNSDSSGYQTMSRSTCNIPKKDEINISNKLPLSSSIFKQSVKKCKQFKRKTDIVSHTDSISNMFNGDERILMKDIKNRSNSIDEIKNNDIPHDLLLQNEIIDTGSTETITSNTVRQMQRNKQFMNASISMPSFNTHDITNEFSYSFRKKFLRNSEEQIDNNLKMKMIPPLLIDTDDAVNINHMNSNSETYANEAKQLKISLNNLHHNFNVRLQQLLLADHKTIQLELERVRLMKQICETATKQNLTRASTSIGTRSQLIEQELNTNGLKQTNQFGNSNRLSVKKYLEVAESVLLQSQNNQFKKEGNFQETENLIIQIFETNQCLQNTLFKKMECYISNSELNKDQWSIDCPSHVYASNSRIISNGLSSYRSNDVTNTHSNSYSKRHSLGRADSSSSSSSTAIIELIDAV